MSFLTDILAMLFVGVILGMGLNIPILLVLHFLMPKAVLDCYWKEPHFRPLELALFTNTVYAPMRTVMLMGAIAFPRLGRRRNVTEAHALAPQWYRIAAKIFCVWVLTLIIGLFASMTGWTVYMWIAGESAPWEDTWALLFVFACFGGVAINQWRIRRRESDPVAQFDNKKPQPSPSPTLAQLRPPPLFRTSPPLYIVTSDPDPNAPLPRPSSAASATAHKPR